MLLNRKEDSVQSGGLQETGAFTIKAGPKAFDILSSNLYQNKILAVIREIACNAADAHKMCGRSLADIKIHLPTYGNPTFSVRDFGPSMSHSQIMRLYTSYFDSTKDDNNDAIGGFGLGSKSPFSVTDQFTVRAWQDGNCRTYAMYKVDGVPTVSLISSEPSSDPTGIEVSLTVDTSSISQWQREATTYFTWWPIAPRFMNSRVDVLPILDDKNYSSTSTNRRPDGLPEWAVVSSGNVQAPVVFMGLVPYTLNLSALGKLDADAVEMFRDLPLVLIYDVGQVEISPSRETLSYTRATMQTIIDSLKDVAKHVLSGYRTRLAACASLYEARRLLHGSETHKFISNRRLREMFLKSNPTWKGQPVNSHVTLKLDGFPNPGSTDPAKPNYPLAYTLYRRSHYGKSWRRDGAADYESLPHSVRDYSGDETTVYVHTDQITSKTYATLQHTLTTPAYTNIRSFIIMAGAPYPVVSKAFHDAGLPPLIDMTTLPVPPPAAPGTSTRSVTRGYEAAVKPNTPGSLAFRWDDFNRNETALDLTGGGLYVEFWDGQPVGSLYPLREYASGGFFATPPRLVGIPRRFIGTKKIKEALAKHQWVLATDMAAVLPLLDQTKVANTLILQAFRKMLGTSGLRSVYMKAMQQAGCLTPAMQIVYADFYLLAQSSGYGYGQAASFDVNLLPAATQAKIAAGQAKLAAAEAEFDALEMRKPLLKFIPPTNSLDVAAVLDYIRS